MPKITAGSNATVSLTAGQVISVSAGGGLLRFEFPAGTVLFEGDGVDQTFGPYASSGNCVITSLIGAIDYSVSTPPGSVAPYVPSSVDIRGGVIGGMPLSSVTAAAAQIALAPVLQSYSTLSPAPPAVLDLNYAGKMALYGIETFARTATESYTDMAGAAQTAATGVAAFDRQAHTPQLGWVVPKGLKTSANQTCTFNGTGILPASGGYTLVVDLDRPVSFTGAGTILALHGGAVTNRVEIILTTNYQAQFVIQTGGSVVVNQTLGAVQGWYGGPRRLVLVVKDGAFQCCDDGQSLGTTATGTAPTTSNLTQFNVGYTANTAGSGVTGWIKRIQVLPFALSAAQALTLSAGNAPVACWGDSLTAGTGTTGPANTFPEVLRLSRYPHSGVYNGGVGGETSTQIKTRALADTIRNSWTSVFWAGRNNFSNASQVVSDIQAMAANLTHGRYVVLSVINKSDGSENAGSAAYTQILALNAALQAAFPNNYLDIRSLIVAASGGANDAPSAAWSADGLHLNNTGYAYVAQQVSSYLAGKTWF